MNLLEFMKKSIKELGGEEVPLADGFQFTVETWAESKENSKSAKNGVVYGFVIQLNDNEKEELIKEAEKLGGLSTNGNKVEPICDNYYVLYWGKSTIVNGRGQAHLGGHKNNNNLHLNLYNCLADFKIAYAFVYVKDYDEIEKGLIESYPTMLKTF